MGMGGEGCDRRGSDGDILLCVCLGIDRVVTSCLPSQHKSILALLTSTHLRSYLPSPWLPPVSMVTSCLHGCLLSPKLLMS